MSRLFGSVLCHVMCLVLKLSKTNFILVTTLLLRIQQPELWQRNTCVPLLLDTHSIVIHFCLPLCADLIIKHLLSLKALWTFFTRWSLRASQTRCSIRPPWTSRTRYSRWPLHEEQCKCRTVPINKFYFCKIGVSVSPFHLSLLESL